MVKKREPQHIAQGRKNKSNSTEAAVAKKQCSLKHVTNQSEVDTAHHERETKNTTKERARYGKGTEEKA
eukprot:1153588-Pelagomonas_calceolata.AAC.9